MSAGTRRALQWMWVAFYPISELTQHVLTYPNPNPHRGASSETRPSSFVSNVLVRGTHLIAAQVRELNDLNATAIPGIDSNGVRLRP